MKTFEEYLKSFINLDGCKTYNNVYKLVVKKGFLSDWGLEKFRSCYFDPKTVIADGFNISLFYARISCRIMLHYQNWKKMQEVPVGEEMDPLLQDIVSKFESVKDKSIELPEDSMFKK